MILTQTDWRRIILILFTLNKVRSFSSIAAGRAVELVTDAIKTLIIPSSPETLWVAYPEFPPEFESSHKPYLVEIMVGNLQTEYLVAYYINSAEEDGSYMWVTNSKIVTKKVLRYIDLSLLLED